MKIDHTTEPSQKLREIATLVDSLHLCMLTTRNPSTGHLVSRPMMTRQRQGLDFYFLTKTGSEKSVELEADSNVNLAFLKESTGEYVSVSGLAKIIKNDREKVYALWGEDVMPWLAEEEEVRQEKDTESAKDSESEKKLPEEQIGGPGNPETSLLFVQSTSVRYAIHELSTFQRALKVGEGMLTGEKPLLLPVTRELSEREVEWGRSDAGMIALGGSAETTSTPSASSSSAFTSSAAASAMLRQKEE